MKRKEDIKTTPEDFEFENSCLEGYLDNYYYEKDLGSGAQARVMKFTNENGDRSVVYKWFPEKPYVESTFFNYDDNAGSIDANDNEADAICYLSILARTCAFISRVKDAGELEIDSDRHLIIRGEKTDARKFSKISAGYNQIEEIVSHPFTSFPIVLDYAKRIKNMKTEKSFFPLSSGMSRGALDALGFSPYNITTLVPLYSFEEGKTLDSLIRDGNIEDKERLILDIIRSVAGFHQVGIIHRDLNPKNILVQNDGSIKIIDFGISRYFNPSDRVAIEADMEDITIPPGSRADRNHSNEWRCTRVLYPPKNNDHVSHNTEDVYTLGLVSAILLTGKHPLMRECKDYCEYIEMSDEERRKLKKDYGLRVSSTADRKLENSHRRYIERHNSEMLRKISRMFHPVLKKRIPRMSIIARELGLDFPDLPPYFIENEFCFGGLGYTDVLQTQVVKKLEGNKRVRYVILNEEKEEFIKNEYAKRRKEDIERLFNRHEQTHHKDS